MIRSGIGSVMLRDPSRASSPSTEDLRPIEKVPHGTPSCMHSVCELQRSCRPGVLMFGGILMSVKLKLWRRGPSQHEFLEAGAYCPMS